MSQRNKSKIKMLWKQGRNVWEISQLTGIPESEIYGFIRSI